VATGQEALRAAADGASLVMIEVPQLLKSQLLVEVDLLDRSLTVKPEY